MSLSYQKYGFGIGDLRFGIRKKPILDPGSSVIKAPDPGSGSAFTGKKVALHFQQHLVAVPGVEHLLDAEEETLLHVARTGGVLPAAPAAQGVAARYRGRGGGRMEERRWTDVFRLRRGRVSGALAVTSLRINDM